MSNYARAIQTLFEGGWIPANSRSVFHLVCAHDDDCGIYDDKSCNCNVELSIDPNWGQGEQNGL